MARRALRRQSWSANIAEANLHCRSPAMSCRAPESARRRRWHRTSSTCVVSGAVIRDANRPALRKRRSQRRSCRTQKPAGGKSGRLWLSLGTHLSVSAALAARRSLSQAIRWRSSRWSRSSSISAFSDEQARERPSTRLLNGRVAAAPELAAAKRPLREAKRQPLAEDCDVRPRDCVSMHDRVRDCSKVDGSANSCDRRRA